MRDRPPEVDPCRHLQFFSLLNLASGVLVPIAALVLGVFSLTASWHGLATGLTLTVIAALYLGTGLALRHRHTWARTWGFVACGISGLFALYGLLPMLVVAVYGVYVLTRPAVKARLRPA